MSMRWWAWVIFPTSKSSSLLSFPVHLPTKEDSKDLEQDRYTKWKEPGPLNDCIEQSLLQIFAVLSIQFSRSAMSDSLQPQESQHARPCCPSPTWCFWTVVLEKTLESPLDCKEIQPVHSEGDQSWVFFGRTDAKAEAPILWPPHAKSWLIGKDSDAGRDLGQEEKGTTEDEMAGWHHLSWEFLPSGSWRLIQEHDLKLDAQGSQACSSLKAGNAYWSFLLLS